MKILYLGLRPKKGTYHYPVIRTERCESVQLALDHWSEFTHIIFTSQTAVEYWPGPWDKEIIAIGDKTASVLRKKGLNPLIAPVATQEGIIELLKGICGYFFIPCSKLSRSTLFDFLKKEKIPFFSFCLYDTYYQKPEPVPDLDNFDEIVFTSPSTVEGFLQIFKELPQNKKLTAIGPITEKALKKTRK